MKRTLHRTIAVGAVFAAALALAVPASATSPSPGFTVQAMAARGADALVATRPSALFASAGEQFVQQGVTSSAGMQYVSYERTYQGLPVIGGDFVVVTDGTGAVQEMSVAQQQAVGTLATTPRITSARATQLARGQLAQVDSVTAPVLSVYALDGKTRLAWDTRVTGNDGKDYSIQSVYVDARTGAILGTQEHVMHGTGNTVWNGPTPVQIATTHQGANFLLRDPAHPTEQCQNAANNTTFTKTTDTWGNGNATNRETGCADAMFVIQKENQMLSQWVGRNSFDGNGGGWPIRVGLNDLNAFYDGSQVQMGHNQQNQWITSLDVVAHEHGHGVDDHTPGRISRGGTQEFVADVFGASTEWFANEPAPFDTRDFLVGERINLVGSGPIRNMFNPQAVGNNPNCFSNAVPNMEVHAAAGPGNHFFYLLAEGSNPTDGQPTSPTCNGQRVTGVGTQAAFTIFYNAMLRKTTASGYPRYRLWTLQAAKALTPGNCTNFNAVKAAWNAVSVPAQAGEPACP
ncbi:M4 family metallopeptidase [Actinocrispum wychmicini]|uniref:Zn-dependent metalloprotease n=1 Tax=Actinocrispum wychmicini TaxID=1213861 RepID=A0A4R2JLC1_9PSEU|nr:M4 family metallopeptidase [Actinocrispum wychmicini]TCO60831.1 Zn-dependent metalloprotease [Actinocrispum wychmicini]